MGDCAEPRSGARDTSQRGLGPSPVLFQPGVLRVHADFRNDRGGGGVDLDQYQQAEVVNLFENRWIVMVQRRYSNHSTTRMTLVHTDVTPHALLHLDRR